MQTAITQGIKVSVEVFYHAQQSQPAAAQHVFAYRITIENQSKLTVQLLRRHWYIFDTGQMTTREVEGEGVVGQQPILEPNERHQYVSGCHLHSEMGWMRGTFLMQRFSDEKNFEVEIPTFKMIVPAKMN
ncbi:MAG: Co2+/Mg2+ efflux protein ApaG [Chitinophagales bacterium]